MNKALVPYEAIEKRIYQIRGKRVMLDRDLAELYGVQTFRLNEQVKRNNARFPEDFMFQITVEEYNNLKCHFGTSSSGTKRSNLISQIAMSSWGGRRHLPYAFTEQGVAMLSSVLNSERSIVVNIAIMRAFVKIHHMISNNQELAKKIELLEKRVFKHDANIRELVRDIRKLTIERSTRKYNVGFVK